MEPVTARGASIKRPLALAVACAFVVCCGGVDQQKFAAVSQAGKALQAELEANGRTPRPEARDRLKEFDNEIAALHDKTIGRQEADALTAYGDAAEAYRYFLRFRALALDAEGGQIQLKGPNIEVASRYRLPVDTRGGSKYVNGGQAITILLQAGEQHLADGNRILGIK
jgi:hypothetical protein